MLPLLAIFSFSLFFLLYIHLFYPMLMLSIAVIRRKIRAISCVGNRQQVTTLPQITLLIASYNEALSIEKKILNSLNLNYPSGLIEIIVFSDGSTDGTDTIVQRYEKDGVVLLRYEGRKGKTACQNLAVKRAKGQIIVYSDATSLLDRNALISIANSFIDEKIGCVVGNLSSSLGESDERVAVEETSFLKFSQWVKRLESYASMPVGGSGALFAVRSNLVCELPSDANDDLLRPLYVVFCGYRIVYDENAKAVELFEQGYSDILRKKIRIAERAIYSLKLSIAILNPFRYGIFSLQFLTKVLLRRLVLPGLLFYLISGAVLYYKTGSNVLLLLLCPPTLILLFSLIGRASKSFPRWQRRVGFKICKLCYYYMLSITGAFIGVVKGVCGRKVTGWGETTVEQ